MENLTGFMFGNVDSSGNLDGDSVLGGLCGTSDVMRGLSSLLSTKELLKDVLSVKEEEGDLCEGEVVKAEDATDYGDIEEALSDEDSSSSEGGSENENEAEEEKGPAFGEEEGVDKETSAERTLDKILLDRSLMPPPSMDKTRGDKSRRPLAAMLPEKFKEMDVRELFPEFRANKVLRFSRLFGIKASHRPRIWKGVKKRRKKKDIDNIEEQGSKIKKLKMSHAWEFNYADFPEDPEAYEVDAAIKFHRPAGDDSNGKEGNKDGNGKETSSRKGPKSTDWRTGPAEYWYDLLDLPPVIDNFDYVSAANAASIEQDDTKDEVKDKREEETEENSKEKDIVTSEPSEEEEGSTLDVPDDAFFMVTQVNWEEDVVWNGDDIKHKVLQKLNSKTNAAGWVPSTFNRTAGSFSQTSKTAIPGIKLQTMQQKRPINGDDTWYSIFPVENEELVYGRWEDEVIWDDGRMPRLHPKIVSLDPNDDNIILGIPEDIDPSTLPSDEPIRKVKIIQKHVKQSRMLLNRSGIISVIEEESPPPPPKIDDMDPFNISNDVYYQPKTQESLKVSTGRTLLQHATPVVELQAPFVPTHIGPIKLRLFHRPPVKRFSKGPLMDYTAFYGVIPLQKHIKKKAKARESERELAGGGEIFFMRTPEDISGKDGELVLFEFIEEHSPLLDLVGMCSKIKNYYKRKPENDKGPGKFKYGESTIAHTSPFLGTMSPGQSVQALENNMFRSPVFEHTPPFSDFVIIRTRTEFSIREVDGLFVVGQECPLYEVPGPNSKRANNFARDFLQVFIYRLFWKSRDNPKRIKMDEIKKAFPAHSESSIRKRLKPCAEFHRTGHDSNWWVIKNNFRLPTEEEIRSMVDPEACCAYFSMIAAEQRLRDAGYGEKFLFAQQDEDDEDTALKMDDELKVAPWNTTRAYILAMKGKCLLQLTGPADPTGPAGEGFSYVRIPNKPVNKEEQEQQPKRTVTGTDADLRKLPLKDARAILRNNGVPEQEIMNLSRWQVIDVVRTLSTEKVKAGEDGDHKFSRGNRFSIAEHQERYRDDCQRLFVVQNRVLGSSEVLSSDEAESSEEEEDKDDEDFNEMGKNLENMLSNKKTSSQFLREREELERRSLQKMIMGEGSETPEKSGSKGGSKSKKDEHDESSSNNFSIGNKILKIVRTFKTEDGKEFTRTELVRKPLVIETYIKVRETKDEQFIRQFATIDDQQKEEMKKERRRIQEQLRRIKRNEEKEKLGLKGNKKLSSKALAKAKKDLKLVCGACGGKGHMRTNKTCPKFVPEFEGISIGSVAMTEQDEEDLEKQLMENIEEEELVNVDGTKVKLSAKVLQHADKLRRETVKLKIPKQAVKQQQAKKRSRTGTVEHCDYLTNTNYRPAKRRRTDPLITFATYLEGIHNQLRVMDEALQFLQPVNPKRLPSYFDVIKNPMDLQTIRENIQKKKYHKREEFLSDVNQIVANSAIFNGPEDIHTQNAKKLMDLVIAKLSENEDKLMKLEKAINPLLDDNDQVALTYILDNILNEKIKSMQESWPFMKPVNKKQNKAYYEIVKNPMDLETISLKVTKNQYHSRHEFLSDIELIYSNSLQYNGENSDFTTKGLKILDVTRATLEEYSDHLTNLEEKIKEVQRIALEQTDIDSLGAALGVEEPPKKKRGRPRKKGPKIVSAEFIDVGSEEAPGGSMEARHSEEAEGSGLLEEDLQYSSEEDWEEVVEEDNSSSFTVTVDPLDQQTPHAEDQVDPLVTMNFYQDNQATAGGEEELEVDENYDPSAFLHNLGKQLPTEIKEEDEYIPPPVAAQSAEDENDFGNSTYKEEPVDIKDDLDISDSDDNDEDAIEGSPVNKQSTSHSNVPPPPPLEETPDDDTLWF
ncbi:transcription initiation factor TFIID subunit 1 [Lepeophtheirus salmonis]|nr:transcription initiation factor TFIID subunit 1-like [Lepeophtheirus salmonis]